MKVQEEEIRVGSIPGRGAGERRHGVEIFRQSEGAVEVDRVLGKDERSWGRFSWLLGMIIVVLFDAC